MSPVEQFNPEIDFKELESATERAINHLWHNVLDVNILDTDRAKDVEVNGAEITVFTVGRSEEHCSAISLVKGIKKNHKLIIPEGEGSKDFIKQVRLELNRIPTS